jgi:pilus assembly protein Flp/PilA
MRKFLFIALSFISIGLFAQEPDAVTLTNQGNDALKAKDYKTAFENYSKAIELNEKQGKIDTAMIYNTGYCALKSDMDNEAIPYYKKAIALGYKEVKCYESLAKIYSDRKMLDSMEMILTEGLAKFPAEESLKKFMSICYLKQGLVFYNSGNDIKSAANKSGWRNRVNLMLRIKIH